MGDGLSALFGQQAGSGGASKCPPSGCEVRKRHLFESNVERREWDSTLVIARVSLGLLLLMTLFIRVRRRCRKITDIESKAAVKPHVEDGENVKSRTMIGSVEDVPLAYPD
ncbi:hypothetical protein ARMGADRAFT_1028412 [Armillaria gallica]|uniref:Uncharacterized protein n=1 Tax=Armillaria gallica TaxID=47427 RepID=A0A2H3DXQ8_ARMGA|nr:hypothetical protein ARMGADRAFT_1028412 [Armillaria gallica]